MPIKLIEIGRNGPLMSIPLSFLTELEKNKE